MRGPACQCGILFDNMGYCLAIRDIVCLVGALLDNVGYCLTMWDTARQFGTLLDNIGNCCWTSEVLLDNAGVQLGNERNN